ncbi:MAG TPA: DUF4292 domain-containing protein [Chitinophagaceae bacterium]
MIRSITIVLFFALAAGACRPARKVQKIEEAISKKDTGTAVVITETPAVDSAKLKAEIMDKVNHRRIDFNTFSAKVKVEYESKEQNDGGTAHIRLEKDRMLWVSLTGMLGVEGYRMIVTPDSVTLMNKLDKTVQYRTIEYLQELTDIPFDFATLQDLIVGNPIFTHSNVVSYRQSGDQLLVLIVGDLFKHLLTLDIKDYRLLHSKLDDVNVIRNRTCDITYSDYEMAGNIPFATKRTITVAEKSKLEVKMDFKQYSFNQPLTFPFSIPKNYKIK